MRNEAGTFYLLAAAAAAAIAALVSYVLTPVVQQAALEHGAAHEPRARDLHTRPVPRWGGLAIYAAFVVAVLTLLTVVHWGFGREILWRTFLAGIGVFITGTILSIVGALDDLYDISPGKQMLAQVACALLVMQFG